ncbi:beclin-1-like [Paramacrobiotus metropolitanus]|uniref:beclin-1-like n=1 Tax=Paramacrobiotus metropolitanus TaxID=2943436 RepID=UPI0024461026|nr:beclin-1-like [Paramacrobiotus metropolitanus]
MASKTSEASDPDPNTTNTANSSADMKYRIVCCQRCHQMLDVDANFYQLEEAILAELSADPARSRAPSFQPKDAPVFDEPSGTLDLQKRLQLASMENPEKDQDALPLGYKKLVFSAESSQEKSNKLQLMELLSSVSTVDHPICSSCTDSIMEELELEIQAVEKECVEYEYFLKQFKKGLVDGESGPKEGDVAALEQQLSELMDEEKMLKEQLIVSEEEKKELLHKLDDMKKERSKIQSAEQDYYRERAAYERELDELEEEQESVNYQMRVAEMLLDKLKKTNVFNIAFHIWHQDQFGTINGFRLGRLPGSPVEWPEINAAWGQTVLLLHCLAKKMSFAFTKYKLVPFGSHSYIECLEEQNKKLPLYGDGGFKFFWDSKFDHAMAAFLECLHQFKIQVEKSGSQFCLPYDIDPVHGRIRDVHTGASYSIRAQFNSVEQWTKALKWMLTNLKWGLAWVVAQFGDNN